MKLKRAGLLTKVVVLGLLIYMATALLNLRTQIQEVEAQRADIALQVSALQNENEQLQTAISNSDDPAVLEQAARERGYVGQNETIFKDVAR